MSSLPQVSLDVALIVGRAVFLVFCFTLAAIAFTRWRRAANRAAEVATEQHNAVLARLTAIEDALTGSREQLANACEQTAALSSKLEETEREQRRTPTPAAAAATPSYQIAIRLAKSGASREELMSSCGISRQEAELVQRLHAPRKPKLAAAG